MQQRIVGTELEYSAMMVKEPGADARSLACVPAALQGYVPEEYAASGSFLRNGSRFYRDIGDHPEYAASEEISIKGAVANEFAGDAIVYATMQAIARQEDFYSFQLNRRVADHQGQGWGYHENYSVSRQTFRRPEILRALAAHVATRGAYTGAGTLTANGEYRLSQKLPLVTEAIHSSTTSIKALVIRRDEPHADAEVFARACVVGGDANMSPWSTMMKLGTTSLVADLVEYGLAPKSLIREDTDLVRLAHLAAADLTLKKTIQLKDGSKVRPLDVQWRIFEAIESMVTDHGIDIGDEKREIKDEMGRTLTLLEKDYDMLRDRADGQMHLHDLRGYSKRLGIDWHPEEPRPLLEEEFVLLANRDYRWDTLHKSGIGVFLRDKLWYPWAPDADFVKDRTIHGATETRAGLRSSFLNRLRDLGLPATNTVQDWSMIHAFDKYAAIKDPFATSDEKVDRLFDAA